MLRPALHPGIALGNGASKISLSRGVTAKTKTSQQTNKVRTRRTFKAEQRVLAQQDFNSKQYVKSEQEHALGAEETAVDSQGRTTEARLSISNVQQPPQICNFMNLM